MKAPVGGTRGFVIAPNGKRKRRKNKDQRRVESWVVSIVCHWKRSQRFACVYTRVPVSQNIETITVTACSRSSWGP